VTVGAEKGKAGSARRSPGLVPKDPGSIPGTSTCLIAYCANRAVVAGCAAAFASSRLALRLPAEARLEHGGALEDPAEKAGEAVCWRYVGRRDERWSEEAAGTSLRHDPGMAELE
jgi:hypothetical protein